MTARAPLSSVPAGARAEAFDAGAPAARDIEQMAFAPTPQELERLLFAIESSLQINKRFQLFLWAQGVLQSFLPHQTLILVCGDLEREQFDVDLFASDAVSDALRHEAMASAREVATVMLREWMQAGRAPLLSSVDSQRARPDDPVTQAIWEMGLGNTLAHGTGELRGPGATFFVFGRMTQAPHRRSRDLIELLLPHLHFAVCRCETEPEAAPGAGHDAGGSPLPEVELSEREVQIMSGVRDGLTNAQIGLELDISPLTVKNHVQRVLRKLGVNNRAQAVARFVAMGSRGPARRR